MNSFWQIAYWIIRIEKYVLGYVLENLSENVFWWWLSVFNSEQNFILFYLSTFIWLWKLVLI